ncbi:MAG: hypothetical protein AAFU73_23025 [Planctomycetota bacterium]
MTEQENERRAQQQGKDECFFVTPLGEPGTATRRQAEAIVNLALEPLCESRGIRARAPHQTDRPDQITPNMMRDVVEARLVVADLSHHNPNVMYELGIRHCFGGPFILIAEKGTSLPFDVNDSLVIFYEADPMGLFELREALRPLVDRALGDPDSIASPVLQAIEIASARERLKNVGPNDRPMALAMERIEDALGELARRFELETRGASPAIGRDSRQILDRDPFDSILYRHEFKITGPIHEGLGMADMRLIVCESLVEDMDMDRASVTGYRMAHGTDGVSVHLEVFAPNLLVYKPDRRFLRAVNKVATAFRMKGFQVKRV